VRLRGEWAAPGLGVAFVVLLFWAIANSTPSWIMGRGPEEPKPRPRAADSTAALRHQRDSLVELLAAGCADTVYVPVR
jgi:hypothetical protein